MKKPTIYKHKVGRPSFSIGRHEDPEGKVYYTGSYQHAVAGITYFHWSNAIAFAQNIKDGYIYTLEVKGGITLKSFKWHVTYFIKHLYKL